MRKPSSPSTKVTASTQTGASRTETSYTRSNNKRSNNINSSNANSNNTVSNTIKGGLHGRNRHRFGYDFIALVAKHADLADHVIDNGYGKLSINFADPVAVKALNKALLLAFYQLSYWDIPEHYLCPPIPGRADYIHYLADLLAEDNCGIIPQGRQIRLLDIGVGANAIYPIIGHAEYGWSFVGSDINPISIKVATLIAQSNAALQGAFQCRLQPNRDHVFNQVIKPKEIYALTLCNPPFHASAEQAMAGSQKKIDNLAKKRAHVAKQPLLNFGGQQAELWCEGGESAFISKMVEESVDYQQQCLWFTSLVSKKETLSIIQHKLKEVGAVDIKVIPMAQGQKISRFIAWSFLTSAQRQQLMVDWSSN